MCKISRMCLQFSYTVVWISQDANRAFCKYRVYNDNKLQVFLNHLNLVHTNHARPMRCYLENGTKHGLSERSLDFAIVTCMLLNLLHWSLFTLLTRYATSSHQNLVLLQLRSCFGKFYVHFRSHVLNVSSSFTFKANIFFKRWN